MRNCSERELPALLAAHVDPMACAWVRHFARGSDDMRVGPLIRAWFRWYARQRRPGAYLGVEVRVAGLTRMFSGSRASDTPGQAPLRPQRRPPCPRHPIVGVCYRGGLRLGRHAAPRRGLTDSKRGGVALYGDPCVTCLPVTSPSNGGNCTIRGATRRRHAEGRLLMLQNPHHYPWRHAPSPVQDYPPGRHTAPRRDLTDSKRGNCTIRGTTRRRHAEGRLLMLQNPPTSPECGGVAEVNCVPESPASQNIWAITPMPAIVRRGGLRLGRHIPANSDLTTPKRGLTATKRGELHH